MIVLILSLTSISRTMLITVMQTPTRVADVGRT